MMSVTQTNERGGCLTAWLALMLIANALTAIFYLTGGSTLQQAYPSASPIVFLILAGLGIANLVGVYGIWTWKKWGFYLFVAAALIALVINLSLGLPILSVLLGLVGVAIFWYLLREKWDAFS